MNKAQGSLHLKEDHGALYWDSTSRLTRRVLLIHNRLRRHIQSPERASSLEIELGGPNVLGMRAIHRTWSGICPAL